MSVQESANSQHADTAHLGRLEDAFARFQGELLGTLYYLLGSREDAQDALQEAFVKCWKNQHQVPEVRNLKAWIFRIALNTGRDIRQAAWRRRREALGEDQQLELTSREDAPMAVAASNEQQQRLQVVLHQLRDEEKQVFLLRQNGDLTYDEIAETLGIPAGTVKTRMRLAVARLREALGHE